MRTQQEIQIRIDLLKQGIVDQVYHDTGLTVVKIQIDTLQWVLNEAPEVVQVSKPGQTASSYTIGEIIEQKDPS